MGRPASVFMEGGCEHRGRKNVIVIGGHQHKTCRTVQNDVNYYLLGTGGAGDMNTNCDDDAIMVPLNGTAVSPPVIPNPYPDRVYLDYAWGQFNVDYKARQVLCTIYHTDGTVVDTHPWNY
jgi:hypothetical protein